MNIKSLLFTILVAFVTLWLTDFLFTRSGSLPLTPRQSTSGAPRPK